MSAAWRVSSGVFVVVTGLAGAARAQPCAAPAGWFPHANTPKPADAVAGADNCGFHQWSWQTFLWLTQTVDGDLRFITQTYTPEEVYNLGVYGPLATKPKALGKKTLTLRPRDSKPTSTRLVQDVNQAGDHGVLVDQAGRAVYYATHLNQVYFDFIRSHGYNDPLKLLASNPLDGFPTGTLMLKSSWRVVGRDEDTTGFYTTNADVEQLKTDDQGHVVVDPHNVVNERVTLVGLHVVGRVEKHPEFIWATFEHRRNAPTLPPGLSIGSTDPVSASGSTFYAANTPARSSNQSNAGLVKLVPPTAQTLQPITNVFRQSDPGGAAGAAEVKPLNDSVHAGLGSEVWANYDLIGSLWNGKEDALEPNRIPGDQRGSLGLTNTTMETFRQVTGNCFSCHNTRDYHDGGVNFDPKNINLSHAMRTAFVLTTQLKQGVSAAKPPKAPGK